MGDLGMPNLSNIPRDRSGYGPRIVVMDVLRSVEIGYKLVSSDKADVEKDLISLFTHWQSPALSQGRR